MSSNTLGREVASFITISEKRGDFDVTKVFKPYGGAGSACYMSMPTGGGRLDFFVSSTGEYPSKYENGSATNITKDQANKLYCRLIPGKTYYVNTRFQDVSNHPNEDSCAASGGDASCGGDLRIGYSPAVPLNGASIKGTSVSTTLEPVVSVEGMTIPPISFPDESSGSKTSIFRPGELNGLNTNINAYAVDPTTRCTNSEPAIKRLWWHNIDMDTYAGQGTTIYYGMEPNEAFTFRFTPKKTGFRSIYMDMHAVTPVPTFLSISSKPCDFDRTKTKLDGCYSETTLDQNGTTFEVISGTAKAASVSHCQLVQGNTYYLNVRFPNVKTLPGYQGPLENKDACEAQSNTDANGNKICGGLMKIQGY